MQKCRKEEEEEEEEEEAEEAKQNEKEKCGNRGGSKKWRQKFAKVFRRVGVGVVSGPRENLTVRKE